MNIGFEKVPIILPLNYISAAYETNYTMYNIKYDYVRKIYELS